MVAQASGPRHAGGVTPPPGGADWVRPASPPGPAPPAPGLAGQAAPCAGAPPGSLVAILAIGGGILGITVWWLALLAFTERVMALAIALAAVALLLAFTTAFWAFQAFRAVMIPGAMMMWKGVAIGAVTIGIVYVGGFFVLPLIAVLLALLCCDPCAGCDPGCETCCDCGCGECCTCGDCGCGDCGCGDCGGCDCSCLAFPTTAVAHGHGERVAFWRFPALPAKRRRQILDRVLAHHPDVPEYAEDTYRAFGRRLCIGCFTTFPMFLGTFALLTHVDVPGSWDLWLVLGAAMALAQAISAAGLARRRWMKVSVKAALGIGMAFLVAGVLSSPWSAPAQVAALLALLALSMLSALPRTLRMRRRTQVKTP